MERQKKFMYFRKMNVAKFLFWQAQILASQKVISIAGIYHRMSFWEPACGNSGLSNQWKTCPEVAI